MNRCILPGFISILILISLTVLCTADQSPTYVAHIQGGESTITHVSNGMVITVKDIDPNVTITSGSQSNLTMIDHLTNITYPLHAAVVFSGNDNESTSMVTVSNLSLSDGNKVLTLQVNPLKYYDGEELKSFANESVDIFTNNVSKNNSTGVFMEVIGTPPTNWDNPCELCAFRCYTLGYPYDGDQEHQCIWDCYNSDVCTSQVQD